MTEFCDIASQPYPDPEKEGYVRQSHCLYPPGHGGRHSWSEEGDPTVYLSATDWDMVIDALEYKAQILRSLSMTDRGYVDLVERIRNSVV